MAPVAPLARAALLIALSCSLLSSVRPAAANEVPAHASGWSRRLVSVHLDYGRLTPLGYAGVWLETVPLVRLPSLALAVGFGESLRRDNGQVAASARLRLLELGRSTLYVGAGASDGRWDEQGEEIMLTRANAELGVHVELGSGFHGRFTVGSGVALDVRCAYDGCKEWLDQDGETSPSRRFIPYVGLGLGHTLWARESPGPSGPSADRSNGFFGRWYGWQTLAVDLAAAGLIAFSSTEETSRPLVVSEQLYPVPQAPGVIGGMLFALGPAVVHVKHRNGWSALGSVALRTLGPLIAVSSFKEGHCSPGCGPSVGALLGTVVLAVAIDAGLLAWDAKN